MRLIDAAALAQEIESLKVTIGGRLATFDEAKSSVLRIIDDQKSVDAAEVLRDQWISVDDRLPEAAETVNKDLQDEFSLSNSVLAFGNNGFAIAMVERDEYHEIFVDMDGNYISEVTHWMPLPEPPEVDKL